MILDTSIILELVSRKADDGLIRRIRAVVRGTVLYASPIHLGELADAARRNGFDPKDAVDTALVFVNLIPIDASIAFTASELKAEARKRKSGRDFSLIDGIGLATARSRGMPMITMDHQFDGFDDVTVIER